MVRGDDGVAPLNLRRPTCFLPPTLTGESPAQGPKLEPVGKTCGRNCGGEGRPEW